MVILNGKKLYEEPTSCGTCPFLFIPGKDAPSFFQTGSSGKYHCTMFDEWHHSWANTPRRCKKMFKVALSYPEGEELGIFKKEHHEL